MSAVVSERPNSELSAGIPGFDRLVWYFLRISGLALVILACGHLIITHFLNVPSETVFDFVANRWANPFWRTFDFLLLFFALWHGILGMRTDRDRSGARARLAGGGEFALLGNRHRLLRAGHGDHLRLRRSPGPREHRVRWPTPSGWPT